MNFEGVSRRDLLAVTAGFVGTAGTVGTTRPKDATGTNAGGNRAVGHIVIFGGGPDTVIEYAFTVSGRLQRSERSGGAPIADRYVTVDGEDGISNRGKHASGSVAGGGDAYRFTGRITRFRISLSANRRREAEIYLDGRRVRPDELGDAPAANTPVEFLDCNTARVKGNFRGVRLHTSFWDEAGLGTNWLFPEPVSGTRVLHPAAIHDPYPFAIDSVSLDARKLEIPGQPAKFTADNPYAGPWCETATNRGSRDGPESKHDGKSGDAGGKRSSAIEFLGCETAVVRGTFERVTIDTSWYDSAGIATSYNEIGPVSGRTRVDRSNVGDVGKSGYVIVSVAAYESGRTEPTVSKRNPDTKACDRKLRSATTETAEKTGTETSGTEATGTEMNGTEAANEGTERETDRTRESKTVRRKTSNSTSLRASGTFSESAMSDGTGTSDGDEG